jgi:endo-1,4-beta-xylanase
MRRPDRALASLAAAAAVAVSLAAAGTAATREDAALKDLAPPGMLIGAALSADQARGADPAAAPLVTRHFSSISPENLLKWGNVHPEPGRYDFAPADAYVELGLRHGMKVVGHTLVWHNQTPAWVFQGKDGALADPETLRARLKEHIQTVVGRYKGRIHGWDVVNEALDEDGTLRKTRWLEILGEEYLALAFELAHQADPQAELYYNDYNLTTAAKRAGALRIVKQLKAKGLRVDGIGEQGHWLLDRPSLSDIESTIVDIAGLGVKVHITELDVDVLPRDPAMYGADLQKRAEFRASTNLYPDGLPGEKQQELARRYADAFALFLKHRDKVARVTFWGVHDAQSWLNGFPIQGRVNHPLLWDRQGRAKPAFQAVVDVLGGRTRGGR